MEYTTLDRVVKSLEKKYNLDKHFEGFVMMVLRKYLDVKVSNDLDIEYLVDIYKSQEELPVDILYLEVSYENNLASRSFYRYCQPKIVNNLLFDSETNRYVVSKQNLNWVYNKMEKIAKEYEKEDLITPDEAYHILKEEYGIGEEIISLYSLNGRIKRDAVKKVAIQLLEEANRDINPFSIEKINKLDIKKIIKDSRENIIFSKTLYKLLSEKCEKDKKCFNYVFDQFGGDFLIQKELVGSFERVIDKIIFEYSNKKPRKDKVNLSYIA